MSGASGQWRGILAQAEEPRYRGLLDRAKETITYGVLRDLFEAVKAPGDAYSGRLPMWGPDGRTSDEAIARSAELGGSLTLGAGAAPAAGFELGSGIRALHGSHTGKLEGADLYFSYSPDVAQQYAGKRGKAFELEQTPDASIMDFDEAPDEVIAAVREAIEDGTGPQFFDDMKGMSDDELREQLSIADIVNSGSMFEDTDFLNWFYERFPVDAVTGGKGGIVLNKDAFKWRELDEGALFDWSRD